MAYKIAAGITEPSTTQSIANCVFAIQAINYSPQQKTATVTCNLYASAAAATGGASPLFTFIYTFTAAAGGVPIGPVLTSIIALAATQTDPFTAAFYTNLLTHPQASAMLAGATVVGTLSV